MTPDLKRTDELLAKIDLAGKSIQSALGDLAIASVSLQDWSRCHNPNSLDVDQLLDDKIDLAIAIGQLHADKKALQVVLRELASATEHFILTNHGFDREAARKAVAEAEGVLGDYKPRYVGDGALTLAEMIRALRNINFDLTCDRCARLFYTGIASGEHSTACTTVK
jgi:hypothetical protein